MAKKTGRPLIGLNCLLKFFDVKVFRVASEDAERDGAYPDAGHAEADEVGGVVVRAAGERLVELAQLGVAVHL